MKSRIMPKGTINVRYEGSGAGDDKDKDKDKDKDPAGGAGGDDKTVSREAFDRLMDQKKKQDTKLTELQTQLNTLLETDRASKDKANQEAGNFKALYEDRDKQVKDLTAKLSTLEKENTSFKEQWTEAQKLSAFKEKLGGKLKKPEYYNFIETDKIALDEKGNIDEASLTNYANSFMKDYKELITFNTGKMPDGSAAGGAKALTYEEWLKLPLADQRKRMHEVMKTKK